MGTEYITKEELQAIKGIVTYPNVIDAWITGGALLREDSPDIDIAVYTRTKVFDCDADNFVCPGYEIEQIAPQYESEDGGKDLIIKLRPTEWNTNKRWIDLLISNKHIETLGIHLWMQKYYPFSIQCCAWSIFTETLAGRIEYDPEVIMCNSFVKSYSKYLKKYKRYYPNASFLRAL